jgi:hypothetical protein
MELTPKEKAKELVDKFRNSITSFLSDKMKDRNAIQCSIIAVKEVLENLPKDFTYNYWQRVLEELKQM